MGAAAGTLALMVGGSDEAFAACQKPFALLGNLVVHAGPVGAGTRMKLARNLIHFVAFTAVTEAQRLAEEAGLNLADLGNVVRHSDKITGGPGSIMWRTTTAPLEADDSWLPIMSHVHALGDKDLMLAIELADELGVDVPLARLAREHLGPGLGLPP
jgi:3-hydroxyisobutyrate dehydrogenase